MTAKEFILDIYPTAYSRAEEGMLEDGKIPTFYEIVAWETRTITNIRLGKDRQETGWFVIGRSECGEEHAWEWTREIMMRKMQMALEK